MPMATTESKLIQSLINMEISKEKIYGNKRVLELEVAHERGGLERGIECKWKVERHELAACGQGG
jgi:hypothetical protein